MKIEQLLVQHFYNCREVTLQGMGTFFLSPDFVMPKENDKDVEIPDHAITFQYNAKAKEDDALIDYIVQQSRKMRSLAAADLDSYLVLGKQFLNIGKPFKIEGMGMLVKTQQGDLAFTKGAAYQSKTEASPVALKEQRENPEISFASESKPAPRNNIFIVAVVIILLLGLTGATAWYFLVRKNNPGIVSVTPPVLTDTLKTDSTSTDSTLTAPVKPVVATDGYTFKVVFMVTADSAAAAARMKVWTGRGHKVIMYKSDSMDYKLAEPFTLPLADTARIKDSLNKFYFTGRAFIEL